MTDSRFSHPLIIQLLFIISAGLLLFAPLMRSGRMSLALLILEAIGLALLVLTLWQPVPRKRISFLSWILIISSLVLPLIYLVPIPFELWKQLPGRELYVPIVDILRLETSPYLALSLVPYRTLSTWLTLIPILGIFIATLLLPRDYIIKLLYVFLGTAVFQASLGLIQYGSGAEWVYWWQIEQRGNAQGTYPNRDHFVALMELALPPSIALTAYNFRKQHHEYNHRENHLLNYTLIFLFIVLLIVLAGIFSRSRAGVMLVLLGFILSSAIFIRHLGSRLTAGFGASVLIIVFSIASSIGLIPVINRFIGHDPTEDVRWNIFQQSWIAIEQFFPIGSGPGTFQPVFLAFHPPEISRFINHVHNDYLEFLLETGVFGIFLIGIFLAAYITGWIKILHKQWTRIHFIQVSAGISLLLMSLHGFLDFNLHTPANAIFFAFLAGIFLHSGHKKSPH